MAPRTLKCKWTSRYKKRGFLVNHHGLEIELFVIPRVAVLRAKY